jgi:hypothetical protein
MPSGIRAPNESDDAMRRSERLTVERLEDRCLLSSAALAWPDATHLTVSFVPDGTAVDGYQSSLFAPLRKIETQAWEGAILQAVQTWAVNANINVGLVADSGAPLGGPGAIEGDARFGDIRIAAHPMASDVLSLGSHFDLLAGTRSGDIVFNSDAQLEIGKKHGFDLFTVTLHEAGNVFGLQEVADPRSVMYFGYQGKVLNLSPTDIQQLQSLYGVRQPDQWEGATGNDTFATATPINRYSIAADITAQNDVDYYKFTVPPDASGTLTVHIQTSGISLLVPKLTVFNAQHQSVSTHAGQNVLNPDISVTLQNVTPGTTYYFKVDGATNDVFGIGSYRLKINDGSASAASQINYLDAFYSGAAARGIVADAHSNDSIATATPLAYQADPRFDYTINAAISDATDVDFYRVTAPTPADGSSPILIASVSALDSTVLYSQLRVYDQNGNPVNAQVVGNSPGSFLVQLVNATPGANYYLEVRAANAGTHNIGTYVLGVNFSPSPLEMQTVTGHTLGGAAAGVQQDVVQLQVAQTQTTHLVLSASAPGATAATALRMRLYDQNGNVVFTLDVLNGQTVSADVFLKKGIYTVSFVAATKDASPLSAVTYSVLARKITEPLDPVPIDPLNPSPPPPNPIGVLPGPFPPPPPDPGNNPWGPLLG